MGFVEVVLKYLRNAVTVRCVSIEAASNSMFSTPGMRAMDVRILPWSMIHAASRRRGPMVVAVLILPCLDHLSTAVL